MKELILFTFLPLFMFGQIVEYRNAHVYIGDGYKYANFYTQDGKLFFQRPGQVDTSIDIRSGYVIPPFAEAHNHNLESSYEIEKTVAQYLESGVFYVKMMSAVKQRIAANEHLFNYPKGLDVSMAHAPLTGKGGHPMGVRKWYLEQGFYGDLFETLEDIEGHGYFILEDKEMLKKKWPEILASKPDFIKVMLHYSEEYHELKDDTTYFGRKGIDPDIMPDLVDMAHRAGLRVTAHVFTIHDFKVAIEAGVDEVAHLPGYRTGGQIEKEIAKKAAKNGTIVVTTASLALRMKDSESYESLISDIKYNLKMLKEAGVVLAIGSDNYNDTSLGEAEFIRGLNIFSNKELLDMWCFNSAKSTFPGRNIGELKEGNEASFLVLDGNPLDDWAHTQSIRMRVKQGEILDSAVK